MTARTRVARGQTQGRAPGVRHRTSMPITQDEAAMLDRFWGEEDLGPFEAARPARGPGSRDTLYMSANMSGPGALAPVVNTPENALAPVEAVPEYPAVPAGEVLPVGAPASTVRAFEVPQGQDTLPSVIVEQPGVPQRATEEELFLQSVPGVAAVPMPPVAPLPLTEEEAGLVAQFMESPETSAGLDLPQSQPPAGAPALSATPDVGVETLVPDVPLPPMPLDEVFKQAWKNLVPSAQAAWSDFKQPFVDGGESLGVLWTLMKGIYQKFLDGEHADEKYADAFGKFLKDRYGGFEAAKRTLANDPVGFLSDASIVLGVGGAALARVPGLAGKAGKVVKGVGSAIDPLGVPVTVAARGTARLLPESKRAAELAEAIWQPASAIVSQSGRARNTLKSPKDTGQ